MTAKSTVTAWVASLEPAELAYKAQLVKQGSLAYTAPQKAALLAAAAGQA